MFRRIALLLLLLCSVACSNGEAPSGGTISIQLKLINASQDRDLTVAIFQRNLAASQTPIVWRVFPLVGSGGSQSFSIGGLGLQVSNSQGQVTPIESVTSGDIWLASQAGNELEIGWNGPSSDISQLEVQNGLNNDAIEALIFRDENLLAKTGGIQPQQIVPFKFSNNYFFLAGDYQPGDPIEDSDAASQISLFGIKSADIVVQGSAGSGYTFSLTNIVF